MQVGIYSLLMVPSYFYAPSWSPPSVMTAQTLLFPDTYSGNSETAVIKQLSTLVYDTFPEGLVFI